MDRACVLYWTPGVDMDRVPAYVRADGFRPATKHMTDGPEAGTSGSLLTPVRGVLELDYMPGIQNWHRLPSGAWMGVDPSAEIRAEGLQRDRVVPGHVVTMAGQPWVVPPARMISGGTGLPRRRVLNPDGTKAWTVEAAYRGLTEFAGRAWAQMQGAAGDITDDELDAAAGEALGVNYRIGEREAIALGLFTADTLRELVRALVDWPAAEAMIEAARKKAHAPG